jgi:hypothetical protein
MRSLARPIAWLCLVLIFGSAWAVIAHRHSSEAKSSSCQVCVVAHSCAPASVSPSPRPVFPRIVELGYQIIDAKQRLIPFALSIRPPPNL